MIIWGSGSKIKHWVLTDGQLLVLRWSYSHLFWFPIAHREKPQSWPHHLRRPRA